MTDTLDTPFDPRDAIAYGATVQAMDMPTTEQRPDSIGEALKLRNPWYLAQATDERWGMLRAILNEIETKADLRRFVVQGWRENEKLYATRLGLTKFLGVMPAIAARILGAIFDQEATFTITDPKVKTWSENVDGSNTDIQEFMESIALEALVMGRIGVLVDRKPTPPGETVTSEVDQERLGTLMPRLRTFTTEEIVDWELDDNLEPVWVKLERRITRKATFEDGRTAFKQWIVVDRTSITVYEGEDKEGAEVNLIASAAHGSARVPFVVFGGSWSAHGTPFMARSMLSSSARADIAGLNEDSLATISRALHASPMLVIRSSKRLEEVIRNPAIGLHLNPEDNEDARYEATDAGGLDTMARAVEDRKVEGFRQAGADPTGFIGAGAMESGTAKSRRFATTEARILSRFARSIEMAAWDILDIASRRLSPAVIPLEVQAFTGTVEYPRHFDLEETSDVLDLYERAGRNIESEEWHRFMVTRIAMRAMGDAPLETRQLVRSELAKQSFQRIEPLDASTGV